MFSFPMRSQPGFDDYHRRNEFLTASPGAMKSGLYGYDNPALLNYLENPNLMFSWSGEYSALNRRGLFIGLPSFGGFPPAGVSILNYSVDDNELSHIRLSTAFGTRTFGVGASYNFAFRDTDYFDRKNTFSIGTAYRPDRYFSFGLTGTTTSGFEHYEGVIDLAVRPFGSEKLTVFSDYALRNRMKVRDGYWSAGAVLEVLPGTHITGRYFNNNTFTFGIEFSFGNVGISTQGGFSSRLNHSHNTYSVRAGSYERNLPDVLLRNPKNYANIELQKSMRYQKYQHFDDAISLMEKLSLIENLAKTSRIRGVVINASGMTINHTMLWEMREQLKKFRENGKKVVIYIENAGMNNYHFASVADLIIMHPLGSVNLPGYITGNMYLGNMLDQIGVGVKEFRLHEYKSGFESFAGDKMSDREREQRQQLVDNLYDFVKEDIMSDRGFTDEEYEKLVNEIFYFTADKALEHGLVDRLARWDDINNIINIVEGEEKTILDNSQRDRILERTDHGWGGKPGIAVIYAVGFCAMETGMKARTLAKEIREARENNRIDAIVLRVESPGGSIMAMDIIAEELRKTRNEKPVVISHGSVAASAGYWLSLYSDMIVSAPNTITGSIGIISGWLYDDGIKEKLGFSTDHVKKGEFADLGYGVPIPLLNIPLLDRTFTEEEEEIIETMLTESYERFVREIADTRGKDYDEAEKISRGRVWSGKDALEAGLVDTLGGLKTAMAIALEKAGFDIEDGYNLIEYPKPLWFNLSGFVNFLVSRMSDIDRLEEAVDPAGQYLQFLKKHIGEPLPLLPLEYLDNSFFDVQQPFPRR